MPGRTNLQALASFIQERFSIIPLKHQVQVLWEMLRGAPLYQLTGCKHGKTSCQGCGECESQVPCAIRPIRAQLQPERQAGPEHVQQNAQHIGDPDTCTAKASAGFTDVQGNFQTPSAGCEEQVITGEVATFEQLSFRAQITPSHAGSNCACPDETTKTT